MATARGDDVDCVLQVRDHGDHDGRRANAWGEQQQQQPRPATNTKKQMMKQPDSRLGEITIQVMMSLAAVVCLGCAVGGFVLDVPVGLPQAVSLPVAGTNRTLAYWTGRFTNIEHIKIINTWNFFGAFIGTSAMIMGFLAFNLLLAGIRPATMRTKMRIAGKTVALPWRVTQWMHILSVILLLLVVLGYYAHNTAGVHVGFALSLGVGIVVLIVMLVCLHSLARAIATYQSAQPGGVQAFIPTFFARFCCVGLVQWTLWSLYMGTTNISAVFCMGKQCLEKYPFLPNDYEFFCASNESHEVGTYNAFACHNWSMILATAFLTWNLTNSLIMYECVFSTGMVTTKELGKLQVRKRDLVAFGLLSVELGICMCAIVFMMRPAPGPDNINIFFYLVLVGAVLWIGVILLLSLHLIVAKLRRWVSKGDAAETVDVFLSHSWELDELSRDNHARVVMISAELQRRGLTTWLDEDKMHGDIDLRMSEGIENAQAVLVFVTQRYIDKVAGTASELNPTPNPQDNCKREFMHAVRRKTVEKLIPVVMEPRCKASTGWGGPVGFNLGGHLYVDFSDDLHAMDQLVRLVCDTIGKDPPHIPGVVHGQRPAPSSSNSVNAKSATSNDELTPLI